MAEQKNTSEPKMRKIKKQVEEYSETLERIVDQLVQKYNKDLDEFITQVKQWLDQKDELTDTEIEGITIKIPVFMYFAVNGLENLGIQKDNAKAVKLEAFNEAVMETEGTVRDKESYAGNATLNEQLIEIAFDRAYRKLKAKMDVCEQLCQASRKVLSKRISEIDINKFDKNTTVKTKEENEQEKRGYNKKPTRRNFRERVKVD